MDKAGRKSENGHNRMIEMGVNTNIQFDIHDLE